jgi:hypothetical protein
MEGKQVRPFSESAGVSCRGYSRGLQRAITDFGADEAFGQGPKKLKEHYGIEVPVSSVRGITQRHGQQIESSREVLQMVPRGGVESLIGEMDGCMLPTVTIEERENEESPSDGRKRRNLDWEEARICLAREPEKITGRYGATMGSPDKVGELFADCVIRAGGGRATKLHCLGDGAPWIVTQAKKRLLMLVFFLLDFYHVSEYLAKAGEVIVGEKKIKWLKMQQERMKANRVSEVLKDLSDSIDSLNVIDDKDHPVVMCKRYFENRLDQLDYEGSIKAGLPIGTGEIEGTHRWLAHKRFKLSGAWWKKQNIEYMLALRVLRANGDWDSYWEELRQAAA